MVRDIGNNHGAGTHHDMTANADLRNNDSTGSQSGLLADMDLAGQSYSRTQMHAFAQSAIVVDAGTGIDNTSLADPGFRIHRTLSEYDTSRT